MKRSVGNFTLQNLFNEIELDDLEDIAFCPHCGKHNLFEECACETAENEAFRLKHGLVAVTAANEPLLAALEPQVVKTESRRIVTPGVGPSYTPRYVGSGQRGPIEDDDGEVPRVERPRRAA